MGGRGSSGDRKTDCLYSKSAELRKEKEMKLNLQYFGGRGSSGEKELVHHLQVLNL